MNTDKLGYRYTPTRQLMHLHKGAPTPLPPGISANCCSGSYRLLLFCCRGLGPAPLHLSPLHLQVHQQRAEVSRVDTADARRLPDVLWPHLAQLLTSLHGQRADGVVVQVLRQPLAGLQATTAYSQWLSRDAPCMWQHPYFTPKQMVALQHGPKGDDVVRPLMRQQVL